MLTKILKEEKVLWLSINNWGFSDLACCCCCSVLESPMFQVVWNSIHIQGWPWFSHSPSSSSPVLGWPSQCGAGIESRVSHALRALSTWATFPTPRIKPSRQYLFRYWGLSFLNYPGNCPLTMPPYCQLPTLQHPWHSLYCPPSPHTHTNLWALQN